jgi:hypothetical protein
MKPESVDFESPIAGSAWITSVELGAGIYFLEGRTHVAGYSTPAERALLERGALLVASIRFDRELLESSRAGHTVQTLGTFEAVRAFRGTISRS